MSRGARAAGRAAVSAALVLLLCLCSSPWMAEGNELRGLLIRPKRHAKPQTLSGVPGFVGGVITSDVKAKLFSLGFSRVASVGSHGYYSLKWDSLEGLLGGGLVVDNALPALQEALGALGFDVYGDYGVSVSLVPNDAFWSEISSSMDQIAAPAAWDVTTGSSSIKVCVIDSGMQFTHPDLTGNMPSQRIYNAITDVESTDADNDGSGHGTHVSGTIGAVANNDQGVAGVSWAVELIGCKFLGQDGMGDLSDAVDCIRWCREQGAKITSNSWGSTEPLDLSTIPGLLDEMQAAEDAGMLFVAASGNAGLNVDDVDTGPGDYNLSSVINVGAVDAFDQLANFSNYGRSTVHLYAPGVRIASTYPTDEYARLSGTSMACPHVSGAAALLWGYVPGATFADIKQAILAGVDIVDGAAQSITGGRLNVAKALQLLTNPGVPLPPSPPATPSPPVVPNAPPSPPDASGGTDAPPPPPPSDGNCTDQAPADTCSQWAAQGYCTGANVAHGQLVYVLCPATCNACGRCEDFTSECASYVEQGYCSYYTTDGFSISDVLCRSSCDSCAQGAIPLSVPSLDISGVWAAPGQPNVYISASSEAGRGYALWLESPPQAMRLRSLGSDAWVCTDLQGGQYKITATSARGDDDTLADTLLFVDVDRNVTWTRNTTADLVVRKYKVRPGDTLDDIAGKFNTTPEELTRLNPFLQLVNGSTVPTNLPVVLPGSSLSGVARLFSFSRELYERQLEEQGGSLPAPPSLAP